MTRAPCARATWIAADGPRGRRAAEVGERGGLDKSDPVRNRDNVFYRHRDELGVSPFRLIPDQPIAATQIVLAAQARRTPSTADPRLDEHPLALSHPMGFTPHNLTRDITPRAMRQRHTRNPPSLPEIEVIERAGPHPDKHLTRTGVGVLHLVVAKHLQTAMFVEPYSFHLVSPTGPHTEGRQGSAPPDRVQFGLPVPR